MSTHEQIYVTPFHWALNMPEAAIRLHVTQEETQEGTRRTLHLDGLHDPKHQSVAVFFDMVGEYGIAPPTLLDGFVFGVVLYAMRLGQDIRVNGTMSRQAVRNCHEFQDAWAMWKPAVYRKIRITPDNAVEATHSHADAEAIAAYSGGVDSTFTVLQHATPQLGLASYPLKRAVLLVHGFDVPLARPEQLDALRDRVAPLLEELNLKVRVLRTNFKELDLQKWEDAFMTELACCLHNYSHEFRYALVASAKAYESLLFPIGSSPATDHLLSGAEMSIVHDGAGYSRTDKVEAIARHETAIKAIKVCWEGVETHKNCGVCEKCVRTILNFRAVGVKDPACFEGERDLHKQIASIKITRYSLSVELRSIVWYARAHGISEPWVADLERRIVRYDIEAAEEKNGSVHNALGMIRRGEWNRVATKIAAKFKSH